MADVKILLVEDENIEAMDIKLTLESFGYEVPYVASSGEEVVEKALEIMPDLILMDIVLKGDTDGIDVASKIKNLNIPVIYLTAHSEESTIERAKLTEPDGIIIKPYNRIELKYAIELALYKNQMENELKENEYNLRLILNSAAEGIFGIDLEGLCTFCNTSSLNILGYDNPNELIGKNIHDLIHQYETSILGFKTGKHVHMEDEEFMMANGTIFSAEYWSYPQIKDQKIIGAVVTFTDITERKQAENELLESEDFLKNIVENIPNMIFIKSADKLNFEMVNKAGEELMGYSREELIGKTDYDFFPKDEADFFTQKDREVLQNKKLVDIPEEIIENNNLGQRILHTKKIPIFNKEGNPQYLLGVSEDITERKKAEKALINSEKRYRTLYSSMTEGLAFHKLIYDDSYDPVDYEIVDVNSAYEELLGISRKEILGKKASEIYGTDKAPYLEIYSDVAQKRKPTHFETYFKPMDKYFNISVFSPEKGSFATVFEDITSRKKAEEKLLTKEKELTSIYNNISDVLYLLSVEGVNNYRFLSVNQAFLNITGLKENQVLDQYVHDVIPEPSLTLVLGNYKKAILEKKTVRWYEETEYPTGIKYGDVSITPLFDTNGQCINLIGSVHDITSLTKAEESLKESDEKYKTLFESNPDYTILLSWDGVIIDFNIAAEQIIGISKEKLVGKNFIELGIFPKEEFDLLEEKFSHLLKHEDVAPFEIRIINKNGEIRYGETSLTIIKKDNMPVSILVICSDITERKKAENKIIQSLQEKEVLLREIHHRVKNNMQIISSLLNLQIEFEDLDKTVGVLKETQGRVKSMAMIHEKLYQSDNLTNINLKEYLEKLVSDIFYSYGIVKWSIESLLDIEDININIDTAIPLGLIVNELVTNSVKYAFLQGEGTIKIKLKSLPEQIELIIADNGIGIPKDFDIGNTKTLGLQLVNNLTDQIDGEIELDRTHGTEFKITFKELKYKERL